MKFVWIILAVASSFWVVKSRAESDSSPFALNFSPGVQSARPDQTVIGLRVNGIYGENRSTYGLDLGVLVSNSWETSAGAALAGFTNITGKQAYILGVQAAGLANVNRGKARVFGFQVAGGVNTIKSEGSVYGGQIAILGNFSSQTNVYGFQVGLINRAKRVTGFQVGLLNFAESLRGFQIGLLNICTNGGLPLPGVPLLNVGF